MLKMPTVDTYDENGIQDSHLFKMHMKLLSWTGVQWSGSIKSRLKWIVQRLLFFNTCQLYISSVLDLLLSNSTSELPYKMCVSLFNVGIHYSLTYYVLYAENLQQILDEVDMCVGDVPQEFQKEYDNLNGHTNKISDKNDERDICNKDKDKNENMKSFMRIARKLDRITIWSIAIVMCQSYANISLSALAGKSVAPLWYYIDINSGSCFIIITILTYFGDFVWICSAIGNLALFIKLIHVVCAQLDCVCNIFVSNSACVTQQTTHILLKQNARLRWAIRRHQRIVRIITGIKEFYSTPLFFLFISVAADICTGIYITFTRKEFDHIVFSALIVVINQVAHMCFYCIFGTVLSDWVERVGDAAYESAWVEGDQSFRRSILIVMRQGYKPFHLTAGWFAKVTLPLLAKILEDAGSYTMVMLAVVDRNDSEDNLVDSNIQ